MKHYRNIFFLLSLCFCFNIQLINAKNQKKYTVKEIDRISNLLDSCDYAESIAEGGIMKGGKTIGGWTTYVKKDRKSNFSRIISENNQRSYFRATFYFVNRKIVKIIVGDDTFYLNDNIPLFIKDKKKLQFVKLLIKDGMKLPY